MSDYNQKDQGEPGQEQPGKGLGRGQDPAPKPGAQTELPDQSNEKSQVTDPGEKDENPPDKVRLYKFPGGESG